MNQARMITWVDRYFNELGFKDYIILPRQYYSEHDNGSLILIEPNKKDLDNALRCYVQYGFRQLVIYM